jgi:hypothetical protein
MTYREVFDTLTLMTLITLTVISFIQARTIRSMRETGQSVNRTWTRHAWAIYDVVANAGLKVPQPPYARPDWTGQHPGLEKEVS